MNHYVARQMKDGRWLYTCNGVAAGYCREYEPIPEDAGWLPKEEAIRHNEMMKPLIANFHTDGHATEQEAQDCYKAYSLDTKLRLQPQEPEKANQQHRCRVCSKFTACYATVGPYTMFCLCPDHQSRAEVEKLFRVGESWQS